jgi:serine/threonine protein kinase
MSHKLNNLVIQGRFHVINKVGEGSFGEVYIAVDRKNGR